MEEEYSDNFIVSQITAGQKDLFRLIVSRYKRPVYGMGISFFRNAEDASDFSQEVFLKVYRSLAEAEVEPNDDDTPERLMLRKAAREAVLAALRELPERYQVCLDLFFFYSCSYREIETITGIPVNTIKSHVFRAKNLLRDKLDETGG